MDAQQQSLAVIGMSLMLPGALNQEQFYQNLKEGKDSVTGPTLERLIYASLDPEKKFKVSAFVGRIDEFDHKFFKISKKEAEFMEPQQRIMLQLACTAIENAGYAPEDFKGSDTAVYLCSHAMFGFGYQIHATRAYQKPDPTIHTGGLNSMICGRISYTLGLTGPSVMIDTGCSSSLVALNEAMEKIVNGHVSAALVGGMVLKSIAAEEGQNGHLGATSSMGKSRAFDADADGIGTGEGGGIFLLKRLDHALRDRDNIQAIIRGIGISQDGGRCNSIAAPSPIAQTAAIKQAWARAGVEGSSIGYIETHGAGTPIGDVIEVQAISDAMGINSGKDKFCALGAVKTNIGHIGNSAGVAGMVKAVLSLKHQELFPALHFNKPNPFIDFDNIPVYVNTEYKHWEEKNGAPRRCGVSSFGLSGTNVHVVLEEAARPEHSSDTPDRYFLKVSAKTPAVLAEYCGQIGSWLQTTNKNFSDALYTLNRGRGDYAYRIGFQAADRASLIAALANFTGFENLPSIKQDKSLTLLFSGGEYTPALVTKLKEHAVFNETFSKIAQAHGPVKEGSGLETFAIQVALYKQAQALGLTIKTVIGQGIGHLVSQVVAGAVPLKNAIAQINNGINDEPVDETKLKKQVRELATRGQVVFMELGATPALHTLLSRWKKEIPTLELPQGLDETATDPIFEVLELSYNSGARVDWKQHYSRSENYRVEAPVYPFEKTRCWYEEPFKTPEADVRDYFYAQRWLPAKKEAGQSAITGQNLLVIGGDEELVDAVANELADAKNTVVKVGYGEGFEAVSDNHYRVSPQSAEDHSRLREAVEGKGIQINGIVHLGAYSMPYELTAANHDIYLNESFIAPYQVARTFADRLAGSEFHYALLSSNGHHVTENDAPVAPLHGMGMVFLKSLLAEHPSLKVTGLDLSYGEQEPAQIAKILVEEMGSEELVRFSATRNNQRFAPDVAAVAKASEEQQGITPQAGTYIVTGGASGIGLETCKYLASLNTCHFVIIGRSALPAKVDWASFSATHADHPHTARINDLQSLEALGSTVSYYTADVSDATAMKKIVGELKKDTKTLAGIIHGAGLGNSGTLLANSTTAATRATLSPKITGTLLLEELSRDLNSAFFLSFSSLAVLVPSRGGADYATANSFEDAFAHAMRQQGKKFTVINWSDWKETGLAYRKRLQRSKEQTDARERVVKGLSNEEGVRSIAYALKLDQPQVTVVNTDMSAFAINPFFTMNREEVATVAKEEDETLSLQQAKNLSGGQALTDTEAKMVGIWYDVLKLDTISLDDDFYELGGHSLNISQLLNKIKKIFGVTVDITQMLEHSTVRTLAGLADSLLSSGHTINEENITPLPAQDYYAVSHAQKRFWILNQQSGREAYSVPAAYVFTGQPNLQALEAAFSQVVERHESLRTGFILVDGVPVQKIYQPGEYEFRLQQEDLENANEATIRQRLQKEASIAFDLERAPLLRIKIFRINPNRWVFFMNLHHIVADAVSIGIIKKEALTIYKNSLQSDGEALQSLSIQYKDFAAWQNRQLEGEKGQELKNYWLNRISNDMRPIKLPTDFSNFDSRDLRSGKSRVVFANENFAQLKELAEQQGTSLFNASLALFMLLLHKYNDAAELIVGTPVSGREHHELDNQVGIYLNTLLLKTEIREDDSFASLLQRVRENTLADLAHQLYPYDMLIQDLKGENRYHPFNVGFTWTYKENIREASGLDFEVEDFATGFSLAKNDLWLFGVEFRESLILEFMYKTALFRNDTMELMAARLQSLAAQVAETPAQPISQIAIQLQPQTALAAEAAEISFNF